MNAIITGASKGIGKAIAIKLIQNGINLAICARTLEDLQNTKKELSLINPSATVLIKVVDMSKKAEVIAFSDYVKKEMKEIDILVNNAGMFIPGATHMEDDGSLEKMIETNLYSAYYLSREIIPSMKKKGAGHIFNMCSVASIKAYDNGGSYSISKYALYGFTKNLREELKPENIKVTAILPGATWSASWEGVDLPKERLMEAEDIAKLVWATLDLSSSATVEDIVVRPQLGDL